MGKNRVEVGAKGGHSSAEVLRTIFGRANGRDVAIRVSYQIFVAGERNYVTLRDHTERYRVRTRRDFENVHAARVDVTEKMLDARYGEEPDDEPLGGEAPRRSVNSVLTQEEQDALAAGLTENEAEDEGGDYERESP